MKHLLKALMEKPRSKAELVTILRADFPQNSQEALRKKCDRFLEKFQKLGLLVERGDKYCWYIYVDLWKDREDYHVKLNHSAKLIPALRRVAGIYMSSRLQNENEYESPADAAINEGCAEDHLRADLRVWKLLDDYQRLVVRAQRERSRFNACLIQKLVKEFGSKPVEASKSSKLKSFIGNNIPSVIYSQIAYEPSPFVKNKDGKIWAGDTLIAKGQLFGKVTKFLVRETADKSNMLVVSQIKKIEGDTSDAQRKLQEEIRRIILKIESGQPLIGGCETCPQVYIDSR
jgi:hypothetical protein